MSNAIDIEALQDVIYTWVWNRVRNTCQGISVIWTEPNAPRPSIPYVGLKFLTGPVKLGHTDVISHVQDDEFVVEGQRTISLSVIVYGTGAHQIAVNLHASLELPSVLEQLRAGGIAIWNEGQVSDISAALETGFEERSNFDVLMGVVSSQTEDVGYIGTAEISGSMNDVDGSVVLTTSQTVPES
jgi:hypothetical protein